MQGAKEALSGTKERVYGALEPGREQVGEVGVTLAGVALERGPHFSPAPEFA